MDLLEIWQPTNKICMIQSQPKPAALSKGLESKLNILPRHLVDAGEISLHPIPGCRVRRVSAHGTHGHLASTGRLHQFFRFLHWDFWTKLGDPQNPAVSYNMVSSFSWCSPLSDTSNFPKLLPCKRSGQFHHLPTGPALMSCVSAPWRSWLTRNCISSSPRSGPSPAKLLWRMALMRYVMPGREGVQTEFNFLMLTYLT